MRVFIQYLVVIRVRLKDRVRCYSTFLLIDFPTHLFVIPILVRLISTNLFARQKRGSRAVSTLHHMIARAERGSDMRTLSMVFI